MDLCRRWCRILILPLLVVVLGVSSARAWLPCETSYLFMGKTVGDTCTLAFMQIAGGECDNWYVHYLTLGPDSLIADSSVLIPTRPSVPFWDTTLVLGRTLEYMEYLWSNQGVFSVNFLTDTIRAPEFDSAFARIWLDSAYNSPAQQRMPSEFFDPPIFNKDVELVYRAKGGLYKNYEIAEVILSGRYAFIRTQGCDRFAEHPRSGLLIYRIAGRPRR